jgi:hypothetical protein
MRCVEKLPGVVQKHAYKAALGLGFTKQRRGSYRGRYATGPCVECLEPHHRDKIAEDLRCPSCRDGKESSAGTRPSLGERSRRKQRVAIDYAWEREQSRKRMQERWAGKREPLGQPRTPVSHVMKNARVG